MKLDICYRTLFCFDTVVRESQNEVRACPTTNQRQQLLNYRLTLEPSARILSFTDYWGTRVDQFGVTDDHHALELTAEASVETQDPLAITATPPLEALSESEFRQSHEEYLTCTRHTNWNSALAKEAHNLTNDEPDVNSAVAAIWEFVNTRLSYEPDSTQIGECITEIAARGTGVCQDFAHLGVALCRSAGIPARYVSGYLFSSNDRTGSIDRDLVRVQTHAWFEAAIPGVGWQPLDPTNKLTVGHQHVKIGHGRDYDDVPPLRGVYSGSGVPEVKASVEIRRMDPTLSPTTPLQPSLLREVMKPHTRLQHQQQQQ
ncbi:MAG: transglutaminase family protein [Acidimicrobiia bacterium]|nr:transglutaminase family protein [Acidimicrobiia bacterium]